MNTNHGAAGLVTLALGMIAAASCQAPRSREPAVPGAEASHVPWAEDLALRLSATEDTVGRGDPARVTYTLTNHGQVGRIRNDPDWLYFEVSDRHGRPIPPIRPAETPHYGLRPEVVLPPGGFFGAEVDLTCAAWQYGTIPDTSCAFAFDLPPGAYRVYVRYAPSLPGDSLAGRAVIRPDPVDSVDLVVTGERDQ